MHAKKRKLTNSSQPTIQTTKIKSSNINT